MTLTSPIYLLDLYQFRQIIAFALQALAEVGLNLTMALAFGQFLFFLQVYKTFATYIPCRSNTDCFIDCDSYATGCSGDIINATNANSLQILCKSSELDNELNGGCQLAEIHCPSGDSSYCNIRCEDINACYQTKIYSPRNTILDLDCLHSQGSCLKTKVNANDAQNVYIHCYGSGELDSSSTAPCQHLDITAGNADSVTMACVDDYSCFDVDLQASNAQSLMVSARGNYALSSSNIYAAHSKGVTLKCQSLKDEYACSDLSIEAPSDPTKALTTVTCEGMGCKKSVHLSSNQGTNILYKSLFNTLKMRVCTRRFGLQYFIKWMQ